MAHTNWKILVRAACLALLLAGNPAIFRGQSSQPGTIPIFSFSANGVTSAQAYQGWALIFDAEISHPNLYSTSSNVNPLLINAQNGSWANTIRLVVTDATGATQDWPLHLADAPTGSLKIDANEVGRLSWVVAPSATTTIAAGAYRVVGILDTTASAGTTGWSGAKQSNPVLVQVFAPPVPATAQQYEQQGELLANYDILVGNNLQASSDIENFLAQQPNNIGLLALKGNLLEQEGEISGALVAYEQALTTFYAANPGVTGEPPDGLLITQRRLRSKLLTQSGVRGQPQVAIKLVNHGVQSPGVMFEDLQITNIGNDVAENVILNQFKLQTVSGTGQVAYNNVFSPALPAFIDFVAVNDSATTRFFFNVPSTVSSYLITESGLVTDIFGTPTSFSDTQTLTATGGILGDVNGDGVVNCTDMAIVKASFGKKVGQLGFDPRADVNGDGVVNVLDLSIVARQLPAGTTCP